MFSGRKMASLQPGVLGSSPRYCAQLLQYATRPLPHIESVSSVCRIYNQREGGKGEGRREGRREEREREGEKKGREEKGEARDGTHLWSKVPAGGTKSVLWSMLGAAGPAGGGAVRRRSIH